VQEAFNTQFSALQVLRGAGLQLDRPQPQVLKREGTGGGQKREGAGFDVQYSTVLSLLHCTGTALGWSGAAPQVMEKKRKKKNKKQLQKR